jgi:hypothetical protein
LSYVAFRIKGNKKAAGSRSAAPADQGRLIVSCSSGHAADLSLTDKDGKRAKDEDQKDEIQMHAVEPQ